MELDQIQQRYLYVIKQGITGALETSVPLWGWEHNRQQDGFERGVPESARTMIGEARLENIRACIEEIVTDKVPGDLIELGCWRGGAGIFMKACLKVYDGAASPRRVWLADTFPDFQPISPPPLPLRLLLCAVIRVTMYLPLKYRRKAVTTAFQDNLPEEEFSKETIDHFLKTLFQDFQENFINNPCGEFFQNDIRHEPSSRLITGFTRLAAKNFVD